MSRGAMPEVVEPGVTGFLADDPAQLPGLVRRAAALDRAAIRARVRERFDMRRTAERYLEQVLRSVGGRVDDAARALGIPRSSLYEKLKRHGISRGS